MINKVEVRGIVCELKGKQVNWCVFAKWTIHDQLRRLQTFPNVLITIFGGHSLWQTWCSVGLLQV